MDQGRTRMLEALRWNYYASKRWPLCSRNAIQETNSCIWWLIQTSQTAFRSTRKAIAEKPWVKEQYKAFIKEFEDMGHLEEVPPDELENGCENHYYFPHIAVFKESSTITNLRVVFDWSVKTSSGVSLNDILRIGPVLQPNIFDLLIRFRLYKFGLTADVAKMYCQTALAKKARRFHWLLWRDNPKDEFRHLQLTRVIYGKTSSGYHAVRSLQETAKLTDNESVPQLFSKFSTWTTFFQAAIPWRMQSVCKINS